MRKIIVAVVMVGLVGCVSMRRVNEQLDLAENLKRLVVAKQEVDEHPGSEIEYQICVTTKEDRDFLIAAAQQLGWSLDSKYDCVPGYGAQLVYYWQQR